MPLMRPSSSDPSLRKNLLIRPPYNCKRTRRKRRIKGVGSRLEKCRRRREPLWRGGPKQVLKFHQDDPFLLSAPPASPPISSFKTEAISGTFETKGNFSDVY